MAALRLELEITAVDPSGEMVFVEGRGPGGVQLGLFVSAGSLAAKAGQRIAVSIEALAPAAPPSMRERMGKAAAAETPRSAAMAPPAPRAAAGPPSKTDVVLSAILGGPPSVEREHDVDDEMDALFGRRK